MSAETLTSISADSTRQQYEEWDKAHKRMKDRPPQDGHSYLRHARNLLPLLESVAELHPISKAVVFSFKAVINFQHDRIENDVRVSSVLLSQTDMMRVILDIHTLAQRRSDTSVVQSNMVLQDILHHVQNDIKDCGNAIDTYYKETKLVKFFKSQEWKARMSDFNQTFINHRINLQQALSIRTASGVGDLNAKMDLVLARVFMPQRDWEKKILAKLKRFGPKEKWLEDPVKLQEMLQLTDDPSVDPEIFLDAEEAASKTKEAEVMRQRSTAYLDTIRDEIKVSIDILCLRNADVFEQKLIFHTQQLREAIANSAAFIVRKLAGPYDRLHHEDLRQLWKEMNWIFCVDNQLFTIALFEFYLDRFSAKVNLPDGDDDPKIAVRSPAAATETSSDYVTKMEGKRHEDAWTLEYLAAYGKQINEAVDSDKSGFIRISEVNVFTDQMPKDWTLPKWCAYVAVGWEYELAIYQKRVEHLLDRIIEAPIKSLPANRYHAIAHTRTYYLIQSLSRGPTCTDFSHLPDPLRNRIREKIQRQDDKYRQHLRTFKYYIDAEDTIRMLYGSKPVETYILQLIALLLEHCLDIMHICETQTVDIRDWLVFDTSIYNLRGLISRRIDEVKRQFRKEGRDVGEAMETFYGGLFNVCNQEYFNDNDDDVNVPWSMNEVERRLTTIEDFSLPPLNDDRNAVLKYSTWETFMETWPDDEEPPERIPPTWGVVDTFVGASWHPRDPAFFPWHISIRCDNCACDPIADTECYRCIDCNDVDICGNCFRLPKSEIEVNGHSESHRLIKQLVYYPLPYRHWITALGRYHHERYLVERGGSSDHYFLDNDGEGSQPRHYTCDECKEEITEGTFYKCLHAECGEYYLCSDCEADSLRKVQEPVEDEKEPEKYGASGYELGDPSDNNEYEEPQDSGYQYSRGYGEEEQPQDNQYQYSRSYGEEEQPQDDAYQYSRGYGEEAQPQDDEQYHRDNNQEPDEDEDKAEPPPQIQGVEDTPTAPVPLSHKPWHTLLVIQHLDFEEPQFQEVGSDADSEEQQAIAQKEQDEASPADGKISGLEARISGLESSLENVDYNVRELKELISVLLERLA